MMRALLVLVTLHFPAMAQIMDTARGRIEFVGLEKWTPKQLDAAVRSRCKAHYCAANLERILGFAESAVFTLSKGESVTRLIVLVENADHVRKKSPLEGEGMIPARWTAISEALGSDFSMALDLALRHYPLLLSEGKDAALAKVSELSWAADQIPAIQKCWAFLGAHAGASELPTALWHLDHNPSFEARRIAAGILMNFHDQDIAWWALADGMRDADDRVNGVCWQVLRTLAEHHARKVDWRPAAPALRALLGGTHCFGLPDLCEILARTDIDADLGPVILTEGEELVFALADSHASFARQRARALLARLTGEAEGVETEQFRAALARRASSRTERLPGSRKRK